MTPRPRPRCALALLALAAGLAHADPVRRVLVDRELEPAHAALAFLDAERVGVAGPAPEEIPASRLLAILPESRSRPDLSPWFTQDPRPGEGTPAVVELTDGQVLLARVAPLAGAGLEADDAITVAIDGAGLLAIPLERVAAVRFDLAPDAGDPAAEDELRLRNGDVLAGFVVALGRTVTIETQGSTVEVPADDARSVRLANPPEPPRATMVSLADGSVLAAASLERAPGSGLRLTLELATRDPDAASAAAEPRPITLALGDVLAVRYHGAGPTLLALSELEPEAYAPTGGRRWTTPPRAQPRAVGSVGDVSLPAPMSVRWALPAGASRFATALALGPGDWADCEVTIEAGLDAGATALRRVRLRAADPDAALAVDLPAGARTLTVRVDPGERGPIQDAVRLVRPMVLVER